MSLYIFKSDGLAHEGSHNNFTHSGCLSFSEMAMLIKQDINSSWSQAPVREWYEGNRTGVALFRSSSRRDETILDRLRIRHTRAQPHLVWPKKEFPLIKVGKFTLNRNPKNYFAEVEQLAFPPSDMVPGIEPSPDKMLQGRLFAYADTQRYRLGANYLQIPVNCPYRTRSRNYERDGPDTVTDNQDGAPNYYPNSFSGPVNDPDVREPPFEVSGDVDRWNSENEDNFTQPKSFYRKVRNLKWISKDMTTHTVNNLFLRVSD
ncbi:UNVERIFIED_CONTAM: Catalase [Trichonephila clavipes]